MSYLYLWCKTLHILFVILWMSGMIAVPWVVKRLAWTAPRSETTQELLETLREYNLRCTSPAMGAAWCLGLFMANQAHFFVLPWMHAKLALALVLSGIHGYFSGTLRRLAADPAMLLPPAYGRVHLGVVAAVLGVVALVIHKPG